MERRKHERVPFSAKGLLIHHGESLGRCSVQNLSAGGALLEGDRGLRPPSRHLELLLSLPEGAPMRLRCRPARNGQRRLGAHAVNFKRLDTNIEDTIHEFVLQSIMKTKCAPDPAALIISANQDFTSALQQELSRTHRKVLVAKSPESAIDLLKQRHEVMGTAALDLSVGTKMETEILRYSMKEQHRMEVHTYPAARVARVAHASAHGCRRAQG